MKILRQMQELLTQLYDAPVEHEVEDFLVTERKTIEHLLQHEGEDISDEQVLLVQHEGSVRIGVYIDGAVLDRLQRSNPWRSLDDNNLRDYCTALEGVSHFHYLMWSLPRQRNVSLLELELQAEVDKYASAVALLTRQQEGRLPATLHSRLFHAVSFLPHLDPASRQRYEEANRHAARFCHSLQERFMHPRRSRPEQWLVELRRFFRCGHQEKIRQLAV
jgi:hypothetical protein